jgi:uncharacterized protein YggT (Ycf19 family)
MRTRIWNLLLRTVLKIIIFIGLFKQERNQKQLPCIITTITENQLKYLRKKILAEGVIDTANLFTSVLHRKSEY